MGDETPRRGGGAGFARSMVGSAVKAARERTSSLVSNLTALRVSEGREGAGAAVPSLQQALSLNTRLTDDNSQLQAQVRALLGHRLPGKTLRMHAHPK